MNSQDLRINTENSQDGSWPTFKLGAIKCETEDMVTIFTVSQKVTKLCMSNQLLDESL